MKLRSGVTVNDWERMHGRPLERGRPSSVNSGKGGMHMQGGEIALLWHSRMDGFGGGGRRNSNKQALGLPITQAGRPACVCVD